MQRSLWVPAVFLVAALRLSASPCVAGGTLLSYEALGATGCTIGPQTVSNFIFTVVSVGGGATAVSDSNIFVTPTFGANSFGAAFASSGFSVTGAGFANYLIAFTWDSIPISGMGDVLDPGNVDILTNGCVGAAFVGSSCSGIPVSDHVTSTQLTDFVGFSPTAILGVRDNISLNALGTSASFLGIENDAYIPEPTSLILVALGLTILAVAIRRRRVTSTNG
jgi:hypothetical protein